MACTGDNAKGRHDPLWWIWGICWLALALSGHQLVADYEIFGDDFLESTMAEDNWQLIRRTLESGPVARPYEQIISNLEYYGTLFNLTAYAMQQLYLPGHEVLSFPAMKLKQHLVWLTSLLVLPLTGSIAAGMTRWRWAMLAIFPFILLQPYWFGYAFSQIKDIPFAVAITAISLGGALVAARQPFQPPWTTGYWRQTLCFGLALGLLIGLGAAIRLAALAGFGFWGAAWLALYIGDAQRRSKSAWISVAITGAIAVMTAFFAIWLLHPVAWHQPLSWIMETLRYHSQHPNPAVTLTNGELIPSDQTPWYYLPQWFSAVVPTGFQLLMPIGLAWAWRDACRSTARPFQRALVVTTTLQLLFFPLLAMMLQSNLYNGVYHFLMVFPAIGIFSCYAVVKLFTCCKRFVFQAAVALIALLYAGILFWEMWLLHPFQMNYISEYRRQPELHRYWNMRYEGTSAARWLEEHPAQYSRVSAYPFVYTNAVVGVLLEHYARAHGFTYRDYRPIAVEMPPPGSHFYFISLSRKPMPRQWDGACQPLMLETRILLGGYRFRLGGLWWCELPPPTTFNEDNAHD